MVLEACLSSGLLTFPCTLADDYLTAKKERRAEYEFWRRRRLLKAEKFTSKIFVPKVTIIETVITRNERYFNVYVEYTRRGKQ